MRVLCIAVALACVPLAASAQANAVAAIERAELHRTVDAALLAALGGEPTLAARAALAIGRTKDPAGVPPLRAHLNDPVAGVRAMSAYGLGLQDDRASLRVLMALARNDRNSAVRYAAIDAVGRIVSADPHVATLALANDALIVARADADAIVRAHGAAQLDAFRTTPFARTIAISLERAQMQEHDETVRWHNAWAIYRGYAAVVDVAFLKRALADRNELVRAEAARAWGRRHDRDAAAIVRTALNDPSWRVQFEAREALLRLEHRPPTDHLVVDPPGIHLSPIAAADAPKTHVVPTPQPTPTATPQLSAFATPAPSAQPKYVAPDPATLQAPLLPLARSARDLADVGSAPHPRVKIATTAGDVVVRLYPEWAPSTVANFLGLAEKHYFDGDRWFRIVPDFVVQTGDPTDTGDGDAGYTIPAEENPLEERSGIIAMGLNYAENKPLRDSAGTQFYLTLSPQLHLDRDFSVFGAVQSGFAVLAHLLENDRIIAVTRISDG